MRSFARYVNNQTLYLKANDAQIISIKMNVKKYSRVSSFFQITTVLTKIVAKFPSPRLHPPTPKAYY